MHVVIAIPTYQRAACVDRAIEAALRQSHPAFSVVVVDDGSTDGTRDVLARYASEPRFAALRLGRNVGTAGAKNVALALTDYDAITFHDSDDIPNENKLLWQVRALGAPPKLADPILDWTAVGRRPLEQLTVDIVVGAYEFVKLDGCSYRIDRPLSLVDDFFPTLQFPAQTAGDWCLINSGLFRRSVFERLGGFLDSIEEDRELRNRTIAAGCVYHYSSQSLLTKIECSDSLTVAAETTFDGEVRVRDRDIVWQLTREYRRRLGQGLGHTTEAVPIDLAGLEIEEVMTPEVFAPHEALPMTPATREHLRSLFGGTRAATQRNGRSGAIR